MGRLPGVGRKYKRIEVEHDGVPYLAEVGLAHRPGTEFNAVFCGVNFTASVSRNPFDNLGGVGLNAILANQYCDEDEPVALAIHIATPRPEFTDRGKSSIVFPAVVDAAITEAVHFVTKARAKQRMAEVRNVRAVHRRIKSDYRPTIQVEAATLVMTQAYMTGSDNGTLPANARQIFYAACPQIIKLCGKEIIDSYFTQTLLPDYVADHPGECADWNVVYDDRGHFTEPHTGVAIGLGTLAVRNYVGRYGAPDLIEAAFGRAGVATRGPEAQYSAVLFIEKEGFAPLFAQARIAERFDLAIMSTKGLSNTASRLLVDETCARYQIPLLVMHDFDPSGFSIFGTLAKTSRRYAFKNQSGADFKVIDFGLRLDDVVRMGLQSEPFGFGNQSEGSLRKRLMINEATKAEADYLLTGDTKTSGRRVELNAMTSRQFLDLVEAKLIEHGIGKVIPCPPVG